MKAVGGVRLFIVFSPPGSRRNKTLTTITHPGTRDNPPDFLTILQLHKFAQGLRERINSSSCAALRDSGVFYNRDGLRFFHDGSQNSRFAHDFMLRTYCSVYTDGMRDKPDDWSSLQWLHAQIFEEVVPQHILSPVVVFAGFETLQRLVFKAGVRPRGQWLQAPVPCSFSVIDFPADPKLPSTVHCLHDASFSALVPGAQGNAMGESKKKRARHHGPKRLPTIAEME